MNISLTRRARPARSLKAAAAILAITTAALLTGCGEVTTGSEPSTPPSTAAATTVEVETMFGTVTVPPPADGELTVVALGWSDAEMALALGVKPVATYDWQGFGEKNKGVGPWASSLFGDSTPEIIERGAKSLNYEQIQGLQPDLILNTRSGNDKGEFDRLAEIAPTIYGPKGAGAYATKWRDQLALIGQAVSKPDEAQKVIDSVNAHITETAADHPEFSRNSVASAAKFGDAYGAYLPGDGRFDLLGELGFVNNPAISELESQGFYASVSVENVPDLDADVAVILPIGFTLEQAKSDSLLSSLKVVKDGRAIYLDPSSELSGAWGASSALSIPVVLDQLTPQLDTAANRVTS